MKGQFIHESFYNLPCSAAEGSSRILNDEPSQENRRDYFLSKHSIRCGADLRDDSPHIIRAAISDPKQIKSIPDVHTGLNRFDVVALPGGLCALTCVHV